MKSKSPKILVVDDDPHFRNAVISILKANGYRVAEESSSLSVIRAINKEKPDLILLDLKMPKAGGIEVIKTMRRMSIYIPVVVVSGHLSQQNFHNLRVLGVEYFLVKPINLRMLVAKVKEAIELKAVHHGDGI